MKHLLLTTIAAVVLVGCGESQQTVPAPESKPVEPVAEAAQPEPPTAKAPAISIHEATYDGNIEAVKQHIAAGTDVNAKDKNNDFIGWTPLLHAASDGHKEITELLINNGADLNVKDREGLTPLHYAVYEGHKEVVALLIAKGADVNAKNKDDETPLDWPKRLRVDVAGLLRKHGGKRGSELPPATLFGAVKRVDLQGVKDFLAKGADVNVKDRVGLTPLHSATTKEIAELLIDKGADVNAKSGPFRETPLHNAASGGHKEIVELLIAAGADVSAKGLVFYGERTPLHRAAGKGRKGIAELLIVEGADLNAKDEWEYTPLHYAASEGHKVIVELLIAKGADVNVKSNVRGVNTNKTPLDWAIKQKHAETAALLRKHGGKTGDELKAEEK